MMRQLDHLEGSPQDGRPLHLAVGMFDGVHRGHQAVIGAAIQSARQSGGKSAVLTFWPHPSRIFRPDNPTRMISSPEIKVSFLEAMGVDYLVQQPFDTHFSEMEAESFPAFLKTACPDVDSIFIGENFRFGKGRRGDVDLLIEMEKTSQLHVVSAPRIRFNGMPVSSTRIREALEAGRLEEANQMLGYPYFSLGVVKSGNQKGSEMGFPTLNMAWDPECRPALGVYAVTVVPWDPAQPQGRLHPRPSTGLAGVANFGLRPTVGDLIAPLVEVHLLQEKVTLGQGDRLKVEWHRFLRPERKFENFEALREQIAKDEEQACRFFGI